MAIENPVRLVLHTLAGIGLFAAVGTAAVMLHLLTNWVASKEVSGVVVAGLRAAEIGIFVVDMFCFALFMVVEAIAMVQTLLGPWRDGLRRLRDG